jgi:glycosyltransferase involved in cell wall biosynthesis
MRIALISSPWLPVPPPAYGGTEAVLDTLARGLRAAGEDVLLCAPGDSTCPVPIAATRSRSAGTDAVGAAVELAHLVRAYEAACRWGADVVHDHTLAGPLFAPRFDLPVVTTNHGPFDDELLPLYRAISSLAPIVAISEHQASTAQDIPIAAVIHHGIDVDAFPLGEGAGGFAVFVGRMTAAKGVDRAARIARAAGVPLKIAAKCREPAEHRYFREHVAPLLGDGVDYVGEVAHDERCALLCDACCLLNPIDWDEPFGMVMVEALACGTPVVATRRGSVPEIVVDGAGYVGESEEELAEAITRVDALDRCACRALVAQRFAASRMVTEHQDLYRRIGAGVGRSA